MVAVLLSVAALDLDNNNKNTMLWVNAQGFIYMRYFFISDLTITRIRNYARIHNSIVPKDNSVLYIIGEVGNMWDAISLLNGAQKKHINDGPAYWGNGACVITHSPLPAKELVEMYNIHGGTPMPGNKYINVSMAYRTGPLELVDDQVGRC